MKLEKPSDVIEAIIMGIKKFMYDENFEFNMMHYGYAYKEKGKIKCVGCLATVAIHTAYDFNYNEHFESVKAQTTDRVGVGYYDVYNVKGVDYRKNGVYDLEQAINRIRYASLFAIFNFLGLYSDDKQLELKLHKYHNYLQDKYDSMKGCSYNELYHINTDNVKDVLDIFIELKQMLINDGY